MGMHVHVCAGCIMHACVVQGAVMHMCVVQDAVMRRPTTNQAARAANIVYAMLQFRRSMEREELSPVGPLHQQFFSHSKHSTS